MQLGIRLHDVNTGLAPKTQTMEARAKTAQAEGFSCVHLAFSKVITGVTFDDCALSEGLAMYANRVFAHSGLDVAVLGCYLNLAHPDPEKLKEILSPSRERKRDGLHQHPHESGRGYSEPDRASYHPR